ncbi:hypothetical protein [Halobacterium bonnevillei]|uniref:Uncharacterized protein n=1 Tax=Halobacterium bonnevillei TaxID=2692200 RepID=A0A6B0SUP5_9EURY|nr:hypothetical protein [Halobacterium bonnevillei]MXR22520.1 hypothetical protein [Halobacterium bonnevillei]
MVWLLDDPVSMVENLVTAATTDPISAALVLFGGLFVTLSAGAFGVLALGGILDSLVPDTATVRERRQRS